MKDSFAVFTDKYREGFSSPWKTVHNSFIVHKVVKIQRNLHTQGQKPGCEPQAFRQRSTKDRNVVIQWQKSIS